MSKSEHAMQGYYGTRQHLSATTGVRESKITRGLYRDITRALANAYSRPRASILAPMCVISLYSSACSSILWRFFSLFYFYFYFNFFLSFFLSCIPPGFPAMPYYCRAGGIRLSKQVSIGIGMIPYIRHQKAKFAKPYNRSWHYNII